MHIAVSFLLVLAATVATYADPQYLYGYPQPHPYAYPVAEHDYFRADLPSSSIQNLKPEDRFFFGTATLTLATTVVTTTVSSSTTCTTSSVSLSVCSPSGRRRRGFLANQSRGLYFNEEGESPFLPLSPPAVAETAADVADVERVERSAFTMVPFVVEPGFALPNNVRGGRFLVAFGTSTSTTTTTSIYTAILTATCRSTSGYSTCGSTSGK